MDWRGVIMYAFENEYFIKTLLFWIFICESTFSANIPHSIQEFQYMRIKSTFNNQGFKYVRDKNLKLVLDPKELRE